MMTTKRVMRAMSALAALLIAVSGCSGNEDRASAPPETTAPATTTPAPAPPPGPAYRAGPLPRPLPASTGAKRYVATTGSDTNPGTKSQPWETIQHALDFGQPNDQILVRGGVYDGEQGAGPDRGDGVGPSVNASPGGRPEEPITIRPYRGERVTIRGFISLPQASWFRLTGFIIDGQGAHPGAEGVSLGNTTGSAPDHVEISYNEIRNFRPTQSDGAYGILHYSGTNTALIGNRIHDIGRRPFYQHGIYLGRGSHVVVANNVIYDITGGYGIHVWGDVDDSFVTHNTVHEVAASAITIGGNDERGRPDRNLVSGNILAGNHGDADPQQGYAIKEYQPGAGNIIRNNISWDNARSDPFQVQLSATADNLVIDPRFVNAADHDFRLGAGSQAIDRGENLGLLRGADAHLRHGHADAGALERSHS